MPSSTSNSDLLAPPVPERPVPPMQWRTTAIVTALVLAVTLGAWEWHWRQEGAQPTYRNSEGLWAIQRNRINKGEGDATVLVGSSRTLSNINLDIWEKLDGHRPIQLALEGTSPLTPLESLADDPDFHGRVIVGVTPLLFFSGFQYREDVLKYYPKETPAQRWGQKLSMTMLEPYFAFYDDDFALMTVLKRQQWPPRKGVTVKSDVRRLFTSSSDRNMRLWERMEKDVAYQNRAKEIWREFWTQPDPEMMSAMPKLMAKQLDRAEAAVKKLRAKGVKVVFVLHPVDGEFAAFELHAMARPNTWEPLLQRTGAPGIHFQDYPQLQGYWLPEWSHMARADADRYTTALYPLIQEKLK
ncbi:MAG TPA: hypothetical protein VM009_07325 [Terriglobales bacterium]|nr:hypothetical protein [Terriglobales bacterium]